MLHFRNLYTIGNILYILGCFIWIIDLCFFLENSKKDELLSHMNKVSTIVPPKTILRSVSEHMKNTKNALRGIG